MRFFLFVIFRCIKMAIVHDIAEGIKFCFSGLGMGIVRVMNHAGLKWCEIVGFDNTSVCMNLICLLTELNNPNFGLV